MKAESKILQIPLPGGSGCAPTGAVQFENDWPGVFIRGDEAIFLRSAVRQLEERFQDHADAAVTNALQRLGKLAEIIEQQVMVRVHVPKPKPLK